MTRPLAGRPRTSWPRRAGVRPPSASRSTTRSVTCTTRSPPRRTSSPLLGNEEVLLATVERILHSNGGAFLAHRLPRRRQDEGHPQRARPSARRARRRQGRPRISSTSPGRRATEELLFEVIRRLFEALVDGGVLEQLPAEIQRQLILAYTRTSLSFTRDARVGDRALAGLWHRRSRFRSSRRLRRRSRCRRRPPTRWRSRRRSSRIQRPTSSTTSCASCRCSGAAAASRARDWDGKVVVVIDELDKLTEAEGGRESLDELVTGLKNLLTTWGVHFVFIAGPDLHDLSLQHSHRGNSVYDSVFAWQLYVPCVWQATDQLLEAVLPYGWQQQLEFASLADYLRFKARGVPRLLLMELNSLIEWDDGRPYVTLRVADRKRIEFYANIERVLAKLRRARARRLLGIDRRGPLAHRHLLRDRLDPADARAHVHRPGPRPGRRRRRRARPAPGGRPRQCRAAPRPSVHPRSGVPPAGARRRRAPDGRRADRAGRGLQAHRRRDRPVARVRPRQRAGARRPARRRPAATSDGRSRVRRGAT